MFTIDDKSGDNSEEFYRSLTNEKLTLDEWKKFNRKVFLRLLAVPKSVNETST